MYVCVAGVVNHVKLRIDFANLLKILSDICLACLLSRTSKSRSKREKKRFSLKEGSPYEEFALVEALRNLVEQTASWKGL